MTTPGEGMQLGPNRLMQRAGVAEALGAPAITDEAWIEVIQRMDEVYADLVNNQLELEIKNGALEEAQAFIDSVLWSMTDVLVVCDLMGRIVRANACVEDLLHSSRGGLEGKALVDLFSEEHRGRAADLTEEIRAGRRIEDVEMALATPAGEPVLLSVNCAPRRDHAGKLMGFVLIGRPIGELRRAFAALDLAHKKLTRTQQQLISAEKMAALGQLVAGVAHELNNPISFVFGNLHALNRYAERLTAFFADLEGGAEQASSMERHQIQRITADIKPLIDGTLEGAQRVSEIVQDLRRFSSSQKEQLEQFNLVRVVHTAADWVLKSARSKIRIEITPRAALDVRGFKRAIHQITVNLVQNSADVLAGHPAPVIRIECQVQGNWAQVITSDNGPGLRPDVARRVFEPFFTTKPVGEGTGLGLYVSYNLAQEMGGTLEVIELPEGQGACFMLQFPLEGKADA